METAYKKEDNYPDFVLLLVTLLLAVVGTAMIYSSSSIIALEKFNDGQYFLKKQLVFVFLGFTIMVAMTKVPYTHLRKIAYPGMLLCLLLLSLLFVPGIGMRRGGATRWLNLGGFSFQVTEMVKSMNADFFVASLTRKAFRLQILQGGRIAASPCSATSVVMMLICWNLILDNGRLLPHYAA